MRPESITVKMVCRDLPKGPGGAGADDAGSIHLGIQEGKDATGLIPVGNNAITFEAAIRLGERKDGGPNFLGPYAQGPAGQRFLYLNWGRRQADGGFDHFSRAKIQLSHITWANIERAYAAGQPLTAELTMTDPAGSPICATVRPENITWKL